MVERQRMPKKSATPAGEVAVLLEDLRSQFRVFGEGLEDVRGRLAALEAEVRAFNQFASFQKLVADQTRSDVSSLTTMSRKITADIAAIRDDSHKNTADLDAIKNDSLRRLDARLVAVEAKVGL